MLAAEEPAPTARYYVPINLLHRAGAARAGAGDPDRVPAGAYGDQMPTIAFGTHPETGRLFIQGDLNAGGTGARPDLRRRVGDDHLRGLDRAEQSGRGRRVAPADCCGSCATGSGRTPAVPGSFRGGLGIEREYEFLQPAFITFSLERKATPPWGLEGGQAGAVNGVEITSPDGAVRHVRKATQHPIAAGERVRIMTGGGGGSARRPSATPRRFAATCARATSRRRPRGATTAITRDERRLCVTVWAIRCGTLFDGTGAAPLRDAGIIVQTAASPRSGRPTPSPAPAGAARST